ncbi:MAG: FAD:protein FMN transferase [Clostridia bacterium]
MKKIIPFLLVLFSLTACSTTAETTESSLDFFAMDTYMSLSVVAVNSDEVISEAFDIVTEIENAISRTNTESDMYKLNNSDGEIVEVSDITYEILIIALECAEKTDGIFDPTICAVTDLWDIGTADARVPSDEEITTALQTVSYENIVLLDNNQVQLLNGAQIDLGAVGKGYAADKIVEIYEVNDAIRGVISLSGNIYVYGEKEDESLWNIGITDPDDTSEINITLQTGQNSVVTTGAYERFFEEDGEVYHHIFNSSTGYPTDEDIKSVTVVSENSTLADIYATALFAMGYQEAVAFAESEESIDVVIIRDDNTVYVSYNLNITLGEKYEN